MGLKSGPRAAPQYPYIVLRGEPCTCEQVVGANVDLVFVGGTALLIDLIIRMTALSGYVWYQCQLQAARTGSMRYI